jgi:hypothetical protein
MLQAKESAQRSAAELQTNPNKKPTAMDKQA